VSLGRSVPNSGKSLSSGQEHPRKTGPVGYPFLSSRDDSNHVPGLGLGPSLIDPFPVRIIITLSIIVLFYFILCCACVVLSLCLIAF
jgi:hypothetical protein